MISSSFALKPGQTLGRNYFVVELLGSGWEGEVYKVRERRTDIPRAVKLFYPERRLTDNSMRRYVEKLYRLRKCPVVTQYHHRDIARVGRDQVEILVSDCADGEMLSAFLQRQKRKRLPPFEALHLLYALAIGVEPIHDRGEYHGDIHSDNVMVRRSGLGFEVSLLDFFDLGRSTGSRIQQDTYDLVSLLHEVIGDSSGYSSCGPEIRRIILGRKHSLIRKKFKSAGQLRTALESLEW